MVCLRHFVTNPRLDEPMVEEDCRSATVILDSEAAASILRLPVSGIAAGKHTYLILTTGALAIWTCTLKCNVWGF